MTLAIAVGAVIFSLIVILRFSIVEDD